MPLWDKGICQPCRDLLCADKPFNCEKSSFREHWLCRSCHESGDSSASRERVERFSQCRFPYKPSREEKEAFIAFASVYGKSTRQSDGGHIAAAWKQREGLDVATVPQDEVAQDEVAAEANQSLIVVLKIGRAKAEQHQRQSSNTLPTQQNGEWTSIVNRPPTPPESVVEVSDTFTQSQGPSPSKASFATCPIIPLRPGLAKSVSGARRDSEQSEKSNRGYSNTDDDDNGVVNLTQAPGKRRRLHRGLKESSSVIEKPELGTPEPSFKALERDSTFHTSEDLLVKSQKAVERRSSEDKPAATRHSTDAQQHTREPNTIADNRKLEPERTAEPPQLNISEKPFVTGPEPAVIEHEIEESDIPSNQSANHARSESVDGQLNPEKVLEPVFERAENPMVIDLDEEAEARRCQEPYQRHDSDPLLKYPDPVPKEAEEVGSQGQLVVSSLPIRKAERESSQQEQKDNEGRLVSSPTLSPKQLECIEHRPSHPPEPFDIQRQDTSRYQAVVPETKDPGFSAITTMPSSISKFGRSPPELAEKVQMGPSLGPECMQEPETQMTQKPSLEIRDLVANLPHIGAPSQPSPSVEQKMARSLSPKKRPFPVDDYLEQMVAHAKKSRTGSEVSEKGYRNAFTPINNPAKLQSLDFSPEQPKEPSPGDHHKPKTPKRRRRRPKTQNLADLRKIAPATYASDHAQDSISPKTVEHDKHEGVVESSVTRATPPLVSPDISSSSEARVHSYPFLNRKRSQHGGSFDGDAALPPAVSSSRPDVILRTGRQSPNGQSYPVQRRPGSTFQPSPKSKPVPPDVRYGPAPLPSPAESEARLQPELDHIDIILPYAPQHRPESRGTPLINPYAESGIPSRHATPIERPPRKTTALRPAMPRLNPPLPLQFVASNNFHSGSIIAGQVQLPAPSQMYSAPMTPTEQFHSPHRASFPPQFPPPLRTLPSQREQFPDHPSTKSGPSTLGPSALRHYTEQSKLHIYPPLSDGSDFEIVRLGPYANANSFVQKVLSTIPEYAMKAAKLRVTFAWKPEGERGRTLAMRLDNPERKEDAFRHICEEIAGQFRPIGAGGGQEPVTLDVDVILKEGAK